MALLRPSEGSEMCYPMKECPRLILKVTCLKFKKSRFKIQGSKKPCGLRHPELVSGSEEPNRQMLNQRSTPEGAKVNQVQHDK